MEKEFLAKISVILSFSYLVSQISGKIQCSNTSPLGPLLLGVKGGGGVSEDFGCQNRIYLILPQGAVLCWWELTPWVALESHIIPSQNVCRPPPPSQQGINNNWSLICFSCYLVMRIPQYLLCAPDEITYDTEGFEIRSFVMCDR